MARARVLVVDDKENFLKLFSRILVDGYDLTTAGDGTRALSLIAAQEFDVVVTDIRMPGADGFEVLRAVKQRSPDTEVVMMTAYASVQSAVEAIKLGAYDYLQKPFDPDAAALVIGRALERKRLREQAASLRREIEGIYGFHSLVGKSARMREVYTLLEQASGLDITVLINGETGTGKELAARAVHYQSARKEKRFVPVNCGALPQELVESELFGHARGAFTGATGAKPGLFEEAQGGTLFLDEIGEMPQALQVKILRALQERQVVKVGDSRSETVDIRVVAATNKVLEEEIKKGAFREDLYYRLNVVTLRLPPLRERDEDIGVIGKYFLTKYAREFNSKAKGFSPNAAIAMKKYGWPGNVRELENRIKKAVVLADKAMIGAEDMDLSPESLEPIMSLAQAKEEFQKRYINEILGRNNGNRTKTAKDLGVDPRTIFRHLEKLEAERTGKVLPPEPDELSEA